MSNPSAAKPQMTAYQRWELNSFDSPKQDRKAVILPTVEQLERIQQQAHQEGYAAGYHEGGAQAAAEAARLQQLAAAMTEESRLGDQRMAEQLLALALAISKQVLGQALRLHPELILAVINEVLGQVSRSDRHAQLTLHPEDAALVRERIGEHLARSGWDIVEDAQLQRGGCRLHTHDCDVDATLERRWQRVVAAMGDDHAWLD